jgi:predicted transcriptional regulator
MTFFGGLWQNKNMTESHDISEDLDRRIDTLTKRSILTRSQIIEDALAHGRSLAWQEKWIAGVEEGLQAANCGDFASEEEIAAVLNKYNQA